MKFLVTTHKSLSIVDNGKLFDIWRPKAGLLFGITWNESNLFVLCRNGGRQESIEIFDKSLNHVDRFCPQGEDRIRGGHQLYLHPGTHVLYIMDSNNRQISMIDATFGSIVHYKWPHATEWTHINSICSNMSLLYIIEHNGGDPPSNLVILNSRDMKERERVKGVGLHCHNIYIDPIEQSFTTLSSMEYGIKEIDIDNTDKGHGRLRRYKRIEALGLPRWYTRGLGKTKEYWVVGLSMHVEMAPNYWKMSEEEHERKRKERMNCQVGGAVILDNDWNIVEEIAINNRGQIHDIRIISEQDLAHNGIPF